MLILPPTGQVSSQLSAKEFLSAADGEWPLQSHSRSERGEQMTWGFQSTADTSPTHSLHVRLRKHWGRGKKIVRARGPGFHDEIVSSIYASEAPQQYGCLTKTWQHHWTCQPGQGKSHKATLLDEELQVITGSWEKENQPSPQIRPLIGYTFPRGQL